MKKVIFYFSISYMIVFSVLTIYTLFNVKETIYVVTDNSYNDKIASLKTQIDNIEDSKCKDSLYNLLEVCENTNFTGNTSLRKIYETIKENKFLATSYIQVKGDCNIDSETIGKLNPYIVSTSITYENIIKEYLFKYVITLNDNYKRITDDTILNNTEYKMTKLQELDIITKLVEVQNEK